MGTIEQVGLHQTEIISNGKNKHEESRRLALLLAAFAKSCGNEEELMKYLERIEGINKEIADIAKVLHEMNLAADNKGVIDLNFNEELKKSLLDLNEKYDLKLPLPNNLNVKEWKFPPEKILLIQEGLRNCSSKKQAEFQKELKLFDHFDKKNTELQRIFAGVLEAFEKAKKAPIGNARL